MKKKILLPTDFSQNSWNTIMYASELYKNDECDFYLLNAFTYEVVNLGINTPANAGERIFNKAKSKSEAQLEKVLQMIALRNLDYKHTYSTYAVNNKPLDAIKEFVETKDIELIVIGNKGDTDARNIIYGSNAISIMEKIRNCPVLVVPNNLVYKDPKEIVFPTSFKTHFKRRELKFIFQISKLTNSPVRVLHVNKSNVLDEEQKEKKALLEECLDGLVYTFHWLEYDNVQTGLHLFVQSRGSEMIVFINKKHAFFDVLFSKPMVKELGQHAKVPVLVLHDLRN
ncbi:nucleotide-binding universal stress UspA family protein [Gillisia mitskevichiae]|uniref:Nucleotide-binding universal stress UspA family protein n=1 Tax=Gillisia mitskevichiae TaxID=270921 RepID=A0A495PXY4_9FLAO|nr:universal stress protein [Gillisia mitskevichiae]RKS53699.1 nucleotide-binding universal stress UspA family protein [Gillisia mitskevichiae]